MENSQKFKKAIDEIEISERLDDVIAAAVERAKKEQSASLHNWNVKKLCISAAAALAVCVGAGAAYHYYRIGLPQSADNMAMSSQADPDTAEATGRERSASPSADPYSIGEDAGEDSSFNEAAGPAPAMASEGQKEEENQKPSEPVSNYSAPSNEAAVQDETAPEEEKQESPSSHASQIEDSQIDTGGQAEENGINPPETNGPKTATMDLPADQEQQFLITLTPADDTKTDTASILELLSPLGEAVSISTDDILTGPAEEEAVPEQDAEPCVSFIRITLSNGKTKEDVEAVLLSSGMTFEVREIVTGQSE